METSTTYSDTATYAAPSVVQAENTAAMDACRLYKFIVDVPFSLCICLAGLTGNTLTCVVMHACGRRGRPRPRHFSY